jgi:hypothetical protein
MHLKQPSLNISISIINVKRVDGTPLLPRTSDRLPTVSAGFKPEAYRQQTTHMPSFLAPCLPNPSNTRDPLWSEFSRYLRINDICEESNPALEAYQMCGAREYISASQLNHRLSLLHFGIDSEYARLASDNYCNELLDDEYRASLIALDGLFETRNYRFSADSLVYKGINNEPLYEILGIPRLAVGDVLTFPGIKSLNCCKLDR